MSSFMGAGPDSRHKTLTPQVQDENLDMPSCRDVDLYLAKHRVRLAANDHERTIAQQELVTEQAARESPPFSLDRFGARFFIHFSGALACC